MVTQRVFIERRDNSLSLSCAQQRESGYDRLLPYDESLREGASCEEHSCVWQEHEVRTTCNNHVVENVPAFVCLASYDSFDTAFEDWAQGYERMKASSNCGPVQDSVNGFIDNVACVLYGQNDAWTDEVKAIVSNYCLGASS